MIRIELLSNESRHAWNTFVAQHNRGSAYHFVNCADMIHGLFGHETYRFCAWSEQNEVVGILPLVRLKSFLFGDYFVSMPYFTYGSAIGTDKTVEEALMDEACRFARKLGVGHIEFRDTVQRSPCWHLRTDKVAMELQLPQSLDSLWASIGSKLRAQVRRPQKEGAEVIEGGKELIPQFYKVFARNMRDLGTPVYPETFFTSIYDTFPDTVRVLVVQLHGQPVASGFLIGSKHRIEIPWAGSIRAFNKYGVNMLLYWAALGAAIKGRYEIFDFGRSSINSGTYKFKEQWGAKEKQLYWHYWLNEGQSLPRLTPTNPKYRYAVRTWQHLPLFLANRLGPLIVKNLP